MSRTYTPAVFNLTPIADPRRGARLTTALLLAVVPVFVATGEEAGLILGGLLFCVAWPAFVLSWFDGEAEEVTPLPAQVSPLPQLPATASTAPIGIPARAKVSAVTERIVCRCRLEATSGTTPPVMACSAACEAVTDARKSPAPESNAAAVSSQDVSSASSMGLRTPGIGT